MKLSVRLLFVFFVGFLMLADIPNCIRVDAAVPVKLENKSDNYYVTRWVDGKVYGDFGYPEITPGKGVTITKISYTSNNNKVAKVSKKGQVNAVGAGKAKIIIKVTYKKGKKKRTKKLNYTINAKEVTLASSDAQLFNDFIVKQNANGAKLNHNPFWYCIWNVTSSDAAGNRLKELYMGEEKLTGKLALKDFEALERVDVYMNKLIEIDVSGLKNLTYLRCTDNKLERLNASGCNSLKELYCTYNKLTSLNVDNCKSLETLECGDSDEDDEDAKTNLLTKLDVSSCSNLRTLWCNNNYLTKLDLSNNYKLEELRCSGNKMTSLNIRGLKNLKSIECIDNKLSKLDVSDNTSLVDLLCSCNLLSTLDVSNNTKLKYLYIEENMISYIDVSNCKKLSDFYYDNNVYVVGWNG